MSIAGEALFSNGREVVDEAQTFRTTFLNRLASRKELISRKQAEANTSFLQERK